MTIYLSMCGELAAHPELLEGLPKILAGASFVTMCVLTPILLGYVAYATHRVAGPAYRMEQYLKAYLRGEEQGRLTLREKDELQVLASLLDMALAEKDHRETVRTSTAATSQEPDESAPPEGWVDESTAAAAVAVSEPIGREACRTRGR